MIILTIRTDKPEAEVGLYNDAGQLSYYTWQAHRALAESLHRTIVEQCQQAGYALEDIGGIVCYQGPGSFTGLRIGLTVGNALAYSLHIPIVATTGEKWQVVGVDRLRTGDADAIAVPLYDAPAMTTQPKK